MVSAMGEAATAEAKVMAVMAKVAMDGTESRGGDGGGDGCGDGGGDGGGCDGCNDGGGDGCGGDGGGDDTDVVMTRLPEGCSHVMTTVAMLPSTRLWVTAVRAMLYDVVNASMPTTLPVPWEASVPLEASLGFLAVGASLGSGGAARDGAGRISMAVANVITTTNVAVHTSMRTMMHTSKLQGCVGSAALKYARI
jgi:hypothetical protein